MEMDFAIAQLQSEIDQLRSMIHVPSRPDEVPGSDGTVSFTGNEPNDPQSEESQEFTFRSANDSNVVVRMSTGNVVEGGVEKRKTFITIGVYYS